MGKTPKINVMKALKSSDAAELSCKYSEIKKEINRKRELKSKILPTCFMMASFRMI
jgi:hypothetical protein